MKILSILWEWRFIIAVVLALILYCCLEWQKAKSTLYALMFQAKRMAKDAILKSGQEQEEWVVKKALQFLPASFKLFVSEDTVRKIIIWLFNKGKDYLDDGLLNGSGGGGPNA
jgi:hypothetical protein